MPQLRLLHIALCLSAALMAVIFGAMRFLLPDTAVAMPALLTWVFLGLSGMMILAAASFRTSIPSADSTVNEEEWVAQTKGKPVILWAMCEGAVVLAALGFFFGASPMVAGALAAGGLGFLASQSPGTLAGH